MKWVGDSPLRRVVIDTSAFLALTNRSGHGHQTAVAVATRLAYERRLLFMSNVVPDETHALLLNRFGQSIDARFISEEDHNHTVLVRISAANEPPAGEIVDARTDEDYSLSDATRVGVLI